LVTLVAACALALPAAAPAGASARAPAFEDRTNLVAPFSTRLMFDLGVVDLNGDDLLDVFTINHNDQQGLFVNPGGGRFPNRVSGLGFDQSPGFPGWEVPVFEPETPRDGVYLFRSGGTDPVEGTLEIAVEAEALTEVQGSLEFLLPLRVVEDEGADVTTEVDTTRRPARHVVSFTAQDDARIIIEPEQMAAPIQVEIDELQPRSSIFVGAYQLNPPDHRFTLHLQDRHGMAWGDYNRDGLVDVFIARGALKGELAPLGLMGQISDELMLSDGSTFRDAMASSGLVKDACRGRGTTTVDFNRDGLLDLFWECQDSNPALFRGNPPGTFGYDSGALIAAGIRGAHYEWLDVDGDGGVELIAARNSELVIYQRARGGLWKRRQRVRARGYDGPGRLAIADYDNDGDPDLFAPSSHRNNVLVNRSGRLHARTPRSLGLPRRGTSAASWVDYNNDGRVDLHAVPEGLFRRIGRHRFRNTRLAEAETRGDAIANWFDFNNDGARDLLLGTATPFWQVKLLQNHATANHWLQVELEGPRGQYPAAGASVTVRALGQKQRQWVGQNDGSHHSQGHYRLYFGLGDAARVRWLKVRWPDGSVQKLNRVAADRLLHVTFDAS
jgi:ASPIC and UnbV/FG-GAP-like repeat